MKILRMFIIAVFLIALSSCSLFDKFGYITISNESLDHEIWAVYISSSTSSSWGDDKLGSSIIPSLGSDLFEIEVDTYDVGIDVYLLNGSLFGEFDLYDIKVKEEEERSLKFDGSSFYIIN